MTRYPLAGRLWAWQHRGYTPLYVITVCALRQLTLLCVGKTPSQRRQEPKPLQTRNNKQSRPNSKHPGDCSHNSSFRQRKTIAINYSVEQSKRTKYHERDRESEHHKSEDRVQAISASAIKDSEITDEWGKTNNAPQPKSP